MKHTLLLISALLLTALCAACGTKDTPADSAPVTENAEVSTTPSQPVSDGTAEDAVESAPSAPAGSAAPAQDTLEPTEPTLVSSALTPSEGLEFESNGDGTCTLTGIGVCQDKDLVIPLQSPAGDTVTLIAEHVFYSLEDVDSVTLLNYNYEVDERAFQYGEMIQVHIIGGARVIGDSAFASCEELTAMACGTVQSLRKNTPSTARATRPWWKSPTATFILEDRVFQYASLRSLSITGGTLEMGESTFASCEDLAAVTLDGQNISLGEYAFYGCDDLTSVTICDNDRQDNVVTIDDRAFQYCENLTTVVVGTGTVEIGKSVFSGCADALSVVVAGQSYANLT